jgi:hypothetical protein
MHMLLRQWQIPQSSRLLEVCVNIKCLMGVESVRKLTIEGSNVLSSATITGFSLGS